MNFKTVIVIEHTVRMSTHERDALMDFIDTYVGSGAEADCVVCSWANQQEHPLLIPNATTEGKLRWAETPVSDNDEVQQQVHSTQKKEK